ncbi:hypothetical protein C8J56DRAFT_1127207 [Mycena floridula]|nr:hypothetical protein C8J56DRAFT_1127207 [Mycena floridula]
MASNSHTAKSCSGWLSSDRGLRIASKRSLPCPNYARWLEARDGEIMHNLKSYSKTLGHFGQSYEEPDSAVLVMPLVFFMQGSDPRFTNTLKQILKSPENGGLCSNNLIYRYDTSKSSDGVGGEEGTFCLCTLWWVSPALGSVSPAHQTYTRLFLPHRCEYPLWFPENDFNLPDAYKEEGLKVRIGDLGYLSDDGDCNYLINIWESSDHPINADRTPLPATTVHHANSQDLKNEVPLLSSLPHPSIVQNNMTPTQFDPSYRPHLSLNTSNKYHPPASSLPSPSPRAIHIPGLSNQTRKNQTMVLWIDQDISWEPPSNVDDDAAMDAYLALHNLTNPLLLQKPGKYMIDSSLESSN